MCGTGYQHIRVGGRPSCDPFSDFSVETSLSQFRLTEADIGSNRRSTAWPSAWTPARSRC